MSVTKTYLLFDGRARLGKTDEATVLDSTTIKPNRVPPYYPDAIWVEYDVTVSKELINERKMMEIL